MLSACKSGLKFFKNMFFILSTTWIFLRMINENIEDISYTLYVVFGLMLTVFYCRKDRCKHWANVVASFVLMVFTVFSHSELSILNKTLELKWIVTFIITCIGIWAFLNKAMNYCCELVKNRGKIIRCDQKQRRIHPLIIFAVSFISLWVVYYLFFLNQYPGSLSCDTPKQLSQALGLSPYENANPLIHTLFLTLCVRTGLALFGNVNAAVAVYTVAQFTLAAAAFAYLVSTIYKKKYHIALVILFHLYFCIYPHNIIYAVGMWKDTFFALTFVTTLTFLWNLLEKDGIKKWEYIVLFLLILVCSLARNSGWSSLGVGAIALLVILYKQKRKLTPAIVAGAGVCCALFVVMCVYPMCGVTSNGGVTSAMSVPLQQISRVIREENYISEDDYELLGEFLDTREIAEKYEEDISDPIKLCVKEDAMNNRTGEFLKLWLRIGEDNPKDYLKAYIALTNKYWSLNASSWTWDVNIFENDFGVYRERKLFPEKNLADEMYDYLSEIPKSKMVYRSSTILWIAIFGFAVSVALKKRMTIPFYMMILMIYIGLMITSPAALFRYTYAASVCVPIMICLPFSSKRYSGKI